MEVQKNETPRERRVRTDKSLKTERAKTDTFLGHESDAEEQIRLTRLEADRARGIARKERDLSQPDRTREREGEDRAQSLQRKREDEIWLKERLANRLKAEALFGNERRQTDESLGSERTAHDLESEEKAAAIALRDKFLGIVSHDLKNPLGVIIGCSHLMQQDLREGRLDVQGFLHHTEVIDRNAGYMDRMITDLLDVKRIANGKLILEKQRCDINGIFQECNDLFAPIVEEKSLSMTIRPGANQVFVNIDHDRILEVLSNLIGNAIKFTPSQGKITLALKKSATEVEISVTDSGPGVPEEMKSQIFNKFPRLKNKAVQV